MKHTYRDDIDGLRAIAVLAVIFYHAGVPFFSGGYVGVDVFFVISGFLITGIIFREIQSGTFSLTRFYERRIRRIYPAVFALIGFVLIAGAFLYGAPDFEKISRSAAANTVFLSNMLFWRESGYFEDPSTLKPLLHTWSLSVEEQFYIFFPIMMVLIARFFKSNFSKIILLLMLGSFAASVYATYQYTSAAFYFMPLRAWELFLGSLLALSGDSFRAGIKARNFLSTVGLGLIAGSVTLLTEETAFPGWAASLPVLGAGLVLFGGMEENTFIRKILGFPPLVFIGKISYSLYLWHWSLLVMGKYYLIREITITDTLIWLALTFTLSTLSWMFIETPFRSGVFWTRQRTFVLGAGLMTVTFAISLFIYLNQGFPQRFPQIASGDDDAEKVRWGGCITEHRKEPPAEVSLCTIGMDGGEPEFLLWGDSHSRAVAPAVDESAVASGVTGYISAMPGCPPLLGIDRQDQFLGSCSTYNDMVLNYLVQHPELRTVILMGRWSISADGRKFKGEEGATKRQLDVWNNKEGANAELFDLGLNRTVTQLTAMGRRVVIIAGIPEIGYDVPSSYAIASRTGRDVNSIIAPTYQEYLVRNLDARNSIDAIAASYNLLVVDPSTVLCDSERCLAVADNQPLYRDDDHLSTYGAHYISNIFDPLFVSLSGK
ncbi:MAG: acyltransferase [Anaerolineales bacterium]|uniref:acyltransferase family protein n=1 Tax=Candidatus Villigracilis vicinus TaxID=3140679 RepID=UPI0031363E87|nr:acyltransferase [Anaerolineales bacterium]